MPPIVSKLQENMHNLIRVTVVSEKSTGVIVQILYDNTSTNRTANNSKYFPADVQLLPPIIPLPCLPLMLSDSLLSRAGQRTP
jgi:hypothetical protein